VSKVSEKIPVMLLISNQNDGSCGRKQSV